MLWLLEKYSLDFWHVFEIKYYQFLFLYILHEQFNIFIISRENDILEKKRDKKEKRNVTVIIIFRSFKAAVNLMVRQTFALL